MRGISTYKPRTMQTPPIASANVQKFGTPVPAPIRLSTLKLPAGIAKPKTLQGVKQRLFDGGHANAKTVSMASNEVPEVVAPVGSITPGNAVAFDRTAPYKKPIRQAPSVSLEGDGYLRLEDVLTVYPVSRSAWYEGIKQGIYPAPVPLGRRSVGWSRAAIRALVESPPKF